MFLRRIKQLRRMSTHGLWYFIHWFYYCSIVSLYITLYLLFRLFMFFGFVVLFYKSLWGLPIVILNIYFMFLILILLCFVTGTETKTDTIHSHKNCHIFNMMHNFNIFLFEPWKYFLYPSSNDSNTLFIRICNYKTIHMHQRHLTSFHTTTIINQHIQKLNSIYWQIHINVIHISIESILINLMVLIILMHLVYFTYGLPCTHVPTENSLCDFVELAIYL